MSESEFNDYNEIIYERDKLKEQNEKLKEALKVMVNLAIYGVDVCANNSRPEERSCHADGLKSMIEDDVVRDRFGYIKVENISVHLPFIGEYPEMCVLWHRTT